MLHLTQIRLIQLLAANSKLLCCLLPPGQRQVLWSSSCFHSSLQKKQVNLLLQGLVPSPYFSSPLTLLFSLSPTLYPSCCRRQFSLPGVTVWNTAHFSCSLDKHNNITLRNNFGRGVLNVLIEKAFSAILKKLLLWSSKKQEVLLCFKQTELHERFLCQFLLKSRLICKACDLLCALDSCVKGARNTIRNCYVS